MAKTKRIVRRKFLNPKGDGNAYAAVDIDSETDYEGYGLYHQGVDLELMDCSRKVNLDFGYSPTNEKEITARLRKVEYLCDMLGLIEEHLIEALYRVPDAKEAKKKYEEKRAEQRKAKE